MSAWVEARVPVVLSTTGIHEIGQIRVDKNKKVLANEESLKELACKLTTKSTKIACVDLRASIIFENSACPNELTTAAEILQIDVTNVGTSSWCGGCVKLSKTVEELSERVEDLESILKERDCLIVVGELISEVYRQLFNIAKGRGMPTHVKNPAGTEEKVDLSLFLKLSAKPSRLLHKYLSAGLDVLGLTLDEYNILVLAKQQRNDTHHFIISSAKLLQKLEEIGTILEDQIEGAKQVILKHRSLFEVADDPDDNDEYTLN
jgi:predicted nucleic acid-binding protein